MTRSCASRSVWARVPRPRGAAARLRQRPLRDRLQPDRPADRAAEACCRSARSGFRAGSRSSSSMLASSALVALVGFLIFPPLVHQAQALWARAARDVRPRPGVPDRQGLLQEHLTLQEAVERAPGHERRAPSARVAGAVGNVAGGIFGVVTILILTFYMLVEADRLRDVVAAAVSARATARASPRPAATSPSR